MAEQDPPVAPGAIAAPPRESGRAASRSRGRGRSGGAGANVAVSTTLAVLGMALAVAGWFLFNQERTLRDTKRQLADSLVRVAALEDRLRMTDESLSEYDAETDDKMSFWETEIRKVWDIANKRNKRWIEQNQAAIQKGADALAQAEAQVKAMQTTVARLDTSAERQQEVADLVTALDINLKRVQGAQRDLADKVNVAAQAVAGLEANLASRVRENEEAIAAIDASRTTVSRQLTELRNAVNDINARLRSAPAGPATP